MKNTEEEKGVLSMKAIFEEKELDLFVGSLMEMMSDDEIDALVEGAISPEEAILCMTERRRAKAVPGIVCKEGEKMVFGRCLKVARSSKDKVAERRGHGSVSRRAADAEKRADLILKKEAQKPGMMSKLKGHIKDFFGK
jgi:hypothetical protein